MIGVIVNTFTVLLGSAVGLLFKKSIPEKISNGIMTAIGLCTLYIGIDGALAGSNTIVLIVSMVLGTACGTLLDIDGALTRVGERVSGKLSKGGKNISVTEGFTTGCLVFCIGAMTIVGSLNSGLFGDHKLIYTKSVLDLISSCMFAGSLGIGVMFSAAFVFVFQGALVLLSGLLQNVLTDQAMVNELCCAGSVMIIGLGLNLVGVSRFKIANMLPALVFVPFVYMAAGLLPI